jgi:hypothetical protein
MRTFVASLALAASPIAFADADGHGPLGGRLPQAPAVPTLSELTGFDIVPVPVVTMPDQDREAFIAEDELDRGGPKALRFAVPVPVALDESMGQWVDVPGGRVWRVEVAAGNAFTARLHLKGIDLPAGQEIRLSNPGQENSVVGPIEGTGEFGDGTAWGLAMATNRTMIEWFVPEGTRVRGLPFAGVEYYHGYRDIFMVAEGSAAVGTCHLDPVCFPAWSNESNATVRLIFGGFLCSGQLTATTAADETPYVSTANHCISTQSEANSCQFNFFYRRNTCASSATAAGGNSVTGGDLVRTQAASDCTLLMIRPTLPANVYWVGWTSATTGTGTSSTCVHHPDGSYQRISFGTKNASSFNCGSPTTNWSSLSWNSATQYGVTTIGVTEGGSSGSAIYRDVDKKLYGVLTCGASFCATPQDDDGYGRWDVAVNTSSTGFATSLAAGTDDAQEPNDGCASAKALAAGTYSGLTVKRLDEDWYALPVSVGATLTVSMTFTHANGDVDVQLFNACGGAVALDRNANTNNESFSYVNPGPSSVVLMRVYLGADTRNDYSLTFSATSSGPVNDECSGASAVGVGAISFNTASASNSPVTMPAACDEGAGTAMNKDLWYRFTAPCAGAATATTCGTAALDTRLAVYPGAACPASGAAVTQCDDDTVGCGNGTSTVTWPVTAGSTWYVRLASAGTAGGSGTLNIACNVCQADFTGNGVVDGGDLGVLLGGWGSPVTSDLNGDGTTDGADLGLLLSAWGPCQ